MSQLVLFTAGGKIRRFADCIVCITALFADNRPWDSESFFSSAVGDDDVPMVAQELQRGDMIASLIFRNFRAFAEIRMIASLQRCQFFFMEDKSQ